MTQSDPAPVPTNLRELEAYLAAHPLVFSSAADEYGPGLNPLKFDRCRGGGILFRDAQGEPVYVPIDCRRTPYETGVTFRPDGFDVTKFGLTIRYRYLPEEPA